MKPAAVFALAMTCFLVLVLSLDKIFPMRATVEPVPVDGGIVLRPLTVEWSTGETETPTPRQPKTPWATVTPTPTRLIECEYDAEHVGDLSRCLYMMNPRPNEEIRKWGDRIARLQMEIAKRALAAAAAAESITHKNFTCTMTSGGMMSCEW